MAALMQPMLVQVTTNTFCAGLVLDNGWVIAAAPILARYIGWHTRPALMQIKQRWPKARIDLLA